MFDQFDALLLARFQFAFTVSFHSIFPSFSIGLASYLAVLEGLWLWTGREVFLNLFKYWLKIFALAFAMGVVSGIVVSYQFGTNWSVFSDKAGPIIGPLMAYEVMTAFFLEAGFLGIMLFGMNRVGRRLHFAATLAVAVGTFISAFWILSANSWMQTPVGYVVNEAGQFEAQDWWTIVFNPSFPYRLTHTVLAAYLTTALVVGGVGAWHLLRDRGNKGARVMFSMATGMVAVVAPLQILAGDMHGLNTLEHQPAKVMAMEGHFESHPDGAPLILFGIPDQEAGQVHSALSVPKASTLGALLQGIAVEGRAYAGGWWDWLTPFSLLVGVSLVIGYALLGATWLVMKTGGTVQEHCFRLSEKLGIATIACIALVSAATPFLSGAYYERWFSWPQILFTAQVPLLVGIASFAFLVSLRRRREYWPFLIALGLFALGLLGLGISMFPFVVPGAVTIHQAAAPQSSLRFMLVGASVLIPIILTYSGYSYWVFRGKTGQEGYH